MNIKKATTKTGKFIQLLTDLFARWQDEWQYEDIDDYLKEIQKVEPRATEMTTEPFGVKVKVDDKLVHFIVGIIGNKIIVGTKE